MRHHIVEGEPGIFPDPITRLFRSIGRVFGRRSATGEGTPPASGRDAPAAPPGPSDLDPRPPAARDADRPAAGTDQQ